MAKTIKEIADELGVSKTAVSKQIANLGLRSSLRKNGNQFAIENQQEKLIKMAFLENKRRERMNENSVSNEQSPTKNANQNANQPQTENQQEKLIKMAFLGNKQRERAVGNLVSNEQPQTKSQTDNHEVCDLVGVLQTTVDTLQAQLAVKDEQIRELNARLAECSSALMAAQETARAAQALHAGTIQQQLSEREDRAAGSVMEEQDEQKKRRWFSRLFKW
jgi:transcriptional antiterminator